MITNMIIIIIRLTAILAQAGLAVMWPSIFPHPPTTLGWDAHAPTTSTSPPGGPLPTEGTQCLPPPPGGTRWDKPCQLHSEWPLSGCRSGSACCISPWALRHDPYYSADPKRNNIKTKNTETVTFVISVIIVTCMSMPMHARIHGCTHIRNAWHPSRAMPGTRRCIPPPSGCIA